MAKPDSVRLQGFARAYCQTAALYALMDLEVFTHISKGANTTEKLVKALGITALNVRRLVAAALAMRLITINSSGELKNAEDVARFLIKGEADYAYDWLTMTRSDVAGWFKMTEFVTKKEAPSELGMYETLTVEEARKYHAGTYSIGVGAARRFVRTISFEGRKKMLDLGGGSGAYSIQAVKSFPGLSAVVLDLPPVTVVTMEYVKEAGVEDRVSVLPGDLTKTPFPNDIDCAVMASNLPLFSESNVRDAVKRAHDALLPGGEFHLVGEMVYDDRTGPLDAAMWGLAEAIYGSQGESYTVGQCVEFFKEAGFPKVNVQEFVRGTLHIVSGYKAS